MKTIDEYITKIKQPYGTDLNPNQIVANAGKRAVTKLCLNSLWGQFGQRQNVSQTEYVTKPARFYTILLDDRLTDINCIFINKDIVHVKYKFKHYYLQNNHVASIFI